MPKLIRSYALDVIDAIPGSKRTDKSATVTSFLAKLAKSKLQVGPAVGVGMDVRLKAESVSGGGLLAFQRLVHLYAFRNVTASQPSRDTDGAQSRIARASRRSRSTA